MSLPSPRPSGRIEHSLHNESSNRSNSHLVFRWSAHSPRFEIRAEDREDRHDDPREKHRPERRGLQRSERDRFRKEDKPAEEQAEANEPSNESFFDRTQRSLIRMEWIRLEPHTMNECVYGAPDRRRRRRTATYADTTAIAPSTSMRRPKSRAEIPRGPCGFAPP